MARKVYRVSGTQTIEVFKWVKANSPEEAMQIVEDMGIEITDYCNATIGFDDSYSTDITEGGGYIEWSDVEEDEGHDYDEDTERFGYEVWLEGNMIHDSGEYEFETDQEAFEDANDWIDDYIKENPEYEFEDFDIKEIEL